MKIIGIVLLSIVALVVVPIVINTIKTAINNKRVWIPDDYYTAFESDSALEKKYAGLGEYKVKEFEFKSDNKAIDKIRVWYPNEVEDRQLLAPIGNPEPRDFTPLDTSYIFLENGTQTVKMQFDTFPQKIQNRCNLHPCGDEKYSGFPFASPIFSYIYEGLRKIIIPFELKQKRYLAHHSTTLHRTVTRLAPPGVQV